MNQGAGCRRAFVSSDDPKLTFVRYVRQDIPEIVDRAFRLIIEQMEGKYPPRRETVPVTFVSDAGYPNRRGYEGD